MADIAITAANVVPGATAITNLGVSGGTITAGQNVYLDPTTGKYVLADNDSATAAAHHAYGVALTTSSLNQPIVVQHGGDITIGGTLTAGVGYFLSATAGGLCPVADLTSGKTVCQIGLAKSASVLTIDVQFPGVTN